MFFPAPSSEGRSVVGLEVVVSKDESELNGPLLGGALIAIELVMLKISAKDCGPRAGVSGAYKETKRRIVAQKYFIREILYLI